MQTLFRQTLKALNKKPQHSHHCRILEKYKFMSCKYVRLFCNLCLVHTIVNDLALPPLSDFMHTRPLEMIQSVRISSGKMCILFHQTATGKLAFSVKATNEWKILPDDVRIIRSLRFF